MEFVQPPSAVPEPEETVTLPNGRRIADTDGVTSPPGSGDLTFPPNCR
jgi:hypothetical protein